MPRKRSEVERIVQWCLDAPLEEVTVVLSMVKAIAAGRASSTAVVARVKRAVKAKQDAETDAA